MTPDEHIAEYQRTGRLEDVDAAIAGYRKLLARHPDPAVVSTLGNLMSMRYDVAGEESDQLEAIDLHRQAAAALRGHPTEPDQQARLATVLGNRYAHAGDPAMLAECIGLYDAALRGELSDRPAVLANYGMLLRTAYLWTDDRAHHHAAISALREAAQGAEPGSPIQIWRKAKLGSTLIPLAGDPAYRAELEQLIAEVRDHYPRMPQTLQREVQYLLGAVLTADELPAIPEEAWALGREAFRGTTGTGSGHQRRADYLAGLAGDLIEDVRASGRLDRADQAMEAIRQALSVAPPKHPQLAGLHGALGAILGMRMEWSGTTGDMEEMLRALRQAVELTRPEDEDRGMRHSDLGNGLMLKYAQGGSSLAVLDEAIQSFQRALDMTPTHPHIAKAHTGLGNASFYKYERTRRRPDIDRSIEHHRLATELTPPEDPYHALYSSNLSGALLARCEVTRSSDDSEEAVAAIRKAVDATPATSPEQPGFLATLASCLADRYKYHGQTAALDEAVERLEKAIGTAPANHLGQPLLLNTLGTTLLMTRTRAAEAVDAFRNARAAAAAGSTVRAQVTLNLAIALMATAGDGVDWESVFGENAGDVDLAALLGSLPAASRRRRRTRILPRLSRQPAAKGLSALDEAIALLTELTKTPKRAASLGPVAPAMLGAALRLRYTSTDDPKQLQRAIRTLRGVVADCQPSEPFYSTAMFSLAQALVDRWELAASDADRAEALSSYRKAAEAESAPADWRVTAAKHWGEFAMEEGLTTEAVEAFSTAVALLNQAAWRGLGRADQERVLGEFDGIARDGAAAAIRDGRPDTALELLEEGRGVLLSQAIDSRRDYDRLQQVAPDLAEALAAVEDELDAAGRMDLSDKHDVDWARHLDRRPVLARRRRDILDDIHNRSGLEDFLLPSKAADLCTAASAGPVVVINVSRYGCDALIVTPDDVRAVPLEFDAGSARRQAARFTQALEDRGMSAIDEGLDWIWTNVTGPILKALGPDLPRRVWWCPTGPLAMLPLHAAGPALDLVVSSYTPTLRALIHARDQSGPRPERRALVVGVPTAPGEPPLTGVTRELQTLRRFLPTAHELAGPDATHDRVLAALQDAGFVHFACHAEQDLTDPSQARLILQDHDLTLRELAAQRLRHAELAFLSACETSRGSDVLADESVTIAASVQLAGFQHVIGTLWPISDWHAPAVVEAIYAMLTAGGTREPYSDMAATALHHAVLALRQRRPEVPYFWAPYVHVGP